MTDIDIELVLKALLIIGAEGAGRKNKDDN